jgi:hypothetical protein
LARGTARRRRRRFSHGYPSDWALVSSAQRSGSFGIASCGYEAAERVRAGFWKRTIGREGGCSGEGGVGAERRVVPFLSAKHGIRSQKHTKILSFMTDRSHGVGDSRSLIERAPKSGFVD